MSIGCIATHFVYDAGMILRSHWRRVRFVGSFSCYLTPFPHLYEALFFYSSYTILPRGAVRRNLVGMFFLGSLGDVYSPLETYYTPLVLEGSEVLSTNRIAAYSHYLTCSDDLEIGMCCDDLED